MHIEYEVTEQDYLDCQQLAIKSSPVRGVRWTRVVLPVFGVLLLGALIFTAFRQGITLSALPGLSFGLFFCLFLISIPIWTKQAHKRVYAKSKGLHGKLVLDVEDEGIQFRGPLSSTIMSWQNFSKFFEDDKCFIFFHTNEQVFHNLPKRCLSPEQVVAFRQFLERHVGQN